MKAEQIYNLNNANGFYNRLESFSNRFLDKTPQEIFNLAGETYVWVNENETEKARTTQEYMLDWLIFSVFWRNYAHKAMHTNPAMLALLRKLYSIRNERPEQKAQIDEIRGKLIYKFIVSKPSKDIIPEITQNRLARFILWLEASGDFKEEAKRVRLLQRFIFETVMPQSLYQTLLNWSDSFVIEAQTELGIYTKGVGIFLKNQKEEYRNREDILFTARPESDYHLNMFGAWILNEAFREGFEQTKKRAILLPTCMRTDFLNCKAQKNGLEMRCTACNPYCNIGMIKNMMIEENTEIFLIPHSSDFTRFLENWQNNSETGLIGVACVLNLLQGGFEMKALNIRGQCVFLDFAGCAKHWDAKGIATAVDPKQLAKITVNECD